MGAMLGKGKKATIWYNCLLALDHHELLPCRIMGKEVRMLDNTVVLPC